MSMSQNSDYEQSTYAFENMGHYNTSESETPALQTFASTYKPIHGYFAAVVCVLGVLANILNIIVLTRKNMISSTNIILTGLAISDGLTMVFYLPFAIQSYVIYGSEPSVERDTIHNARYTLTYAIASVTLHSISIWLTVTLALFRYVFIRFPRIGAQYCNIQRAKTAVCAVVIGITIVCIPNSISYEFRSRREPKQSFNTSETEGMIWFIDVRNDTHADMLLAKFNFWIQAVIVKILPCFLLTMFSVLLVRTMQDVEKRRKKMITKRPVADGESQPSCSSMTSKRSRQSQRTTRMLVTVVILFLLTEIPQGILSLLSGLIEDFFHLIYTPLGDLLDILALINNGINFVLYCFMSKQFRDTFLSIVCGCFPNMSERRKMQTFTTSIY